MRREFLVEFCAGEMQVAQDVDAGMDGGAVASMFYVVVTARAGVGLQPGVEGQNALFCCASCARCAVTPPSPGSSASPCPPRCTAAAARSRGLALERSWPRAR